MRLFKILHNNHSCSGGDFDWTDHLPQNGQPGEWTPEVENPILCSRGWHGTLPEHLINFLEGNQLFEIEAQGIIWDSDNDKFVARKMRLVRQIKSYNDKNLRLFGCWCVRQLWKYLDKPSKEIVFVAERFAKGKATPQELLNAHQNGRIITTESDWEIINVLSTITEINAVTAAGAVYYNPLWFAINKMRSDTSVQGWTSAVTSWGDAMRVQGIHFAKMLRLLPEPQEQGEK